jgi:anti-anti-sigma factor
MQLSVTQSGDVTVARVDQAKLTYPVLGEFSAALRRIVDDGARKLVVDFAAVVYIDSPAIGCLMDLHRQLLAHGGTFKLAGLQPRVETLLSMTGILRVLEAHATAAGAVKAFAAGASPATDAAPAPRGGSTAPAPPARSMAMVS